MTETKMEVVKLMPKEYTKAEADAFKHGFFLGAKSEREETLLEVAAWINDTFIFSKQAKEDFSQTFNIMKELL